MFFALHLPFKTRVIMHFFKLLKMESCSPGMTSWSFFSFPFIEKLNPLGCSTMPASWQAQGHRPRDRKRTKVEQKGRVIFLHWDNYFTNSSLVLSLLSFIWGKCFFFKNCQLALERGRKLLTVTQCASNIMAPNKQ